MLLLEPSLRYVLGGNFPSAVQSEGAAAPQLIHVWAARELLKTKSASLSRGHPVHWPLQSVALYLHVNNQLALKCRNNSWGPAVRSMDFTAGGWTHCLVFIWKPLNYQVWSVVWASYRHHTAVRSAGWRPSLVPQGTRRASADLCDLINLYIIFLIWHLKII